MLPTKPYYSISEVAAEFELKPSTLRFWETKFDRLKPKCPTGTRRYDAGDIEQIRLIRYLLYDQKMTIEGANDFIRRNKGCELDKMDAISHLMQLRGELVKIREELNQMKQP